MDTFEVAWAAGLFEGEGNFNVTNSGRGVGSIVAQVGMTDRDVIERFNKIFPGQVSLRNHQNGKWKDLYIWQVCGERAFNFIEAVYPFLGARRRAKADELIDVWHSPDSRRNKSKALRERVESLEKDGYNGREISRILDISESYVSHIKKGRRAA